MSDETFSVVDADCSLVPEGCCVVLSVVDSPSLTPGRSMVILTMPHEASDKTIKKLIRTDISFFIAFPPDVSNCVGV